MLLIVYKRVTFPQRFENKCVLEIWKDKRAPDNTKLKPSIHSFYFFDVKWILYFKAFHFSRSNWRSSCIFLYASMTKQAAEPTCCLWKSWWRTFLSRLPKQSDNRTKRFSLATRRCGCVTGPRSPAKRKSRARVFLPWLSINPISSCLPLLCLKERKGSKANVLNGCTSGYLATGNIYSSVRIRNTYGQSHYPLNVSNLSIWWQLKACFKRGIVKTCILWSNCSPCFKLPFGERKKKKCYIWFHFRYFSFHSVYCEKVL